MVLAACGSSDDTPAPAIEPPPPAVVAPPPAATQLKSATDRDLLTTTALDAIVAGSNGQGLAGAARCSVQMVEVVHATIAPGGSATEASGVVMLPGGPSCPGPYPLVSYSRGTDLDRDRALATPGDGEATLVAALLASQGFVVAASDYLGYAQSPLTFHPYLHAASEAATNLDLLRATRELATTRSITLDGRVFLTGYSQGGHASLATQRMVQAQFATEFNVVAAGHMSGPYDLSGSIAASVDALPLGQLGSTYYIPFAVTALRRVDPAIYASPSEFFQSPYDETVETLFPGPAEQSVTDLISDDKLPILFSSLITPEFIAAVNNPASALAQSLKANSPIDFAPTAPTLLCAGSRDPVVDYSNTESAAAAFAGLGATTVSTRDVEQVAEYSGRLRDDTIPVDFYTGYHASLVPPLCMLQVRQWFQNR